MEIVLWCYIIGIILVGTLLVWLATEKWMWLIAVGVVVVAILIWRTIPTASWKRSIQRVEIVEERRGDTTFRIWRTGKEPEVKVYMKGTRKYNALMQMR